MFLGPSTVAGKPIAYPPIYVHHIHLLGKGDNAGRVKGHFFETHGDMAVGSGVQGTIGYLSYIPAPYCYRNIDDGELATTEGIVREDGAGRNFYLEFGFIKGED